MRPGRDSTVQRVAQVLLKEVQMKMLSVCVLLGLAIGVCALLAKESRIARAGQEPGCAQLLETSGGVLVQDMNGDGAFDPIAEAVRLLGWAFLGAPAPVPPCTGGEVHASALPETGQTICYEFVETLGWVGVACEGVTCPGQDGASATGCPGENRFVDNQDGTVTDTCTGLMWQKDTADVDGDGQSTDFDGLVWCDALAYCENLSFAGHDDWRLPNLRELQSIVDYGRFNPSIHPIFRSRPNLHWSSTTQPVFPDLAWDVHFGFGNVNPSEKTTLSRVRAVRTGP
jgi:hypothetical protein